MFTDLFNFSKQRTLKESIGFFIFYSSMALGVMAVLSLMGIA